MAAQRGRYRTASPSLPISLSHTHSPLPKGVDGGDDSRGACAVLLFTVFPVAVAVTVAVAVAVTVAVAVRAMRLCKRSAALPPPTLGNRPSAHTEAISNACAARHPMEACHGVVIPGDACDLHRRPRRRRDCRSENRSAPHRRPATPPTHTWASDGHVSSAIDMCDRAAWGRDAPIPRTRTVSLGLAMAASAVATAAAAAAAAAAGAARTAALVALVLGGRRRAAVVVVFAAIAAALALAARGPARVG